VKERVERKGEGIGERTWQEVFREGKGNGEGKQMGREMQVGT
jgi:hypothetical protein